LEGEEKRLLRMKKGRLWVLSRKGGQTAGGFHRTGTTKSRKRPFSGKEDEEKEKGAYGTGGRKSGAAVARVPPKWSEETGAVKPR